MQITPSLQVVGLQLKVLLELKLQCQKSKSIIAFHINLQAIGIRLEELLAEDRQHIPEVITMLSDETKQKELLIEDEEEDFLDEGKSNINGISQLLQITKKINNKKKNSLVVFSFRKEFSFF